MGTSVAVVGASGYAGGELLRLLAAHPYLDVTAVAAGANAGRPLAAVHPQLRTYADRTLVVADDPSVAAADLVFLALPHGESAALAASLPESALVVDLGADFRLRSAADWQRWYGGGAAPQPAGAQPAAPDAAAPHATAPQPAAPDADPKAAVPAADPKAAAPQAAAPQPAAPQPAAPQPAAPQAADPKAAALAQRAKPHPAKPHAGTWTYGLPELPGARAAIAQSQRVANPGCYATAIILAYAPLLAAGLVEPEDLVVVAASGTSGAGRTPAARLLGSEVMGDLTPYKVAGSHQHLPEIRQALGAGAQLSFTPILAPMPRGILATCTARTKPGVTDDDLRTAVATAYAVEPFVHLLPVGQWPHTAATTGSNACHLQVALDPDAGRAVVVAAIDNLGKGAAGQALQNANIVLGFDETAGLSTDGIAP